MGDISAEPSMEEILSSIKRIIAEEGEAPGRQRRPRGGLAASPPPPAIDDYDDDEDEILELSDPMPARAAAVETPEPLPLRAADPEPVRMPTPPEPPVARAPLPEPAPAEPIVSQQAAAASRGSLESLTRLMMKPEPGSDGTLEGLVREMLRPMLREWLDSNLPGMVETMVAREIERITSQQG